MSDDQGGPGPRILADEALSALLDRHKFGVLATNKRSGHPHLTTMLYDWDPDARTIRFSSTADRVKVKQLRKDPRAALHVSADDHWSFVVAEGEAEISELTAAPTDPERRVVISLKVSRLYGTALDVTG